MTGTTAQPNRVVERLLIGVDGSPTSIVAADWSAALARRLGAEIRLLDVLVRPFSEITPDDDQALRRHTGDTVTDDVASGAPGASAAGPITVAEDEPLGALCDAAESADLLVIGSRAREGFGRHGFFSFAHALAHHTPCPMLVVPPDPRPLSDSAHLLIGVDGSRANTTALGWARRLADQLGGRITAVFVTNPAYDTFDAAGSHGPEELEARHEAGDDPALTYLEAPGNDTASTLRRLASEREADLLVVGARSRHSLGGLLLGSTPDELLHEPGCPTVIIPHGFSIADGTAG